MILKNNQVIMIKEGWVVDLMNKFKDQFKQFFIKLKHQFEYNVQANKILATWAKTGHISKEQADELKTISVDTLKMVGLGGIALMPIPGGTMLMIFLVNSAKYVGIDLIPSHFEVNQDKETKSL